MKRIKIYKRCLLTVLLLMAANMATFACEACNQNQPKILRNITHGGGPEGVWDYFVVIIMVLITIYTLYATIRCFISPTETKYNRIKNEILTPQ